AQLEQSPFLSLLSDQRVAQTLALMAQPKDARLTRELAREVCQRTASAASVEGSISSLGSQYVVGLKAVNCRSGDVLANEQATASGKEQVLKAVGEAATKIREKLGARPMSCGRRPTRATTFRPATWAPSTALWAITTRPLLGHRRRRSSIPGVGSLTRISSARTCRSIVWTKPEPRHRRRKPTIWIIHRFTSAFTALISWSTMRQEWSVRLLG